MVNDPIADLLTRIRNAQGAHHSSVRAPSSKVAKAVLKVLKDEGFIGDFTDVPETKFPELEIGLKYYESGEPVMGKIVRVSSPGRRVYSESKHLPKVSSGLGISIVSTSQGMMSDREARKRGIGGELVAKVG